jgi:hypothetical protein
VLPTLPIAALRKSFQTIGFFFSPAFQPRFQILREALAFLKEEIAWKLVDINYLHPSQKNTHDDLKTLSPAMNVIRRTILCLSKHVILLTSKHMPNIIEKLST